MQMPLHTIIEIQMGVTGVQEKRYKLMETQSENFFFFFPPSLNNCLQDPPH
jgi:6-phosphofructo-2-kinase/fructose-2,6-biphosphatase